MDDGDVSCAFSEFKLTRPKSVSISRQSLLGLAALARRPMILPPYRATPNHPASREENSSGAHSSVLPLGKKNWEPSKLIYLQSPFFKFDIKIWLRYNYITDQSEWAQLDFKHCNQCKWIIIELCNCIILRILSLSYLSDYLTRSESTDCKRIPREENTYCNRQHYQKLLVHFFSLWRIPDHNSSMQTAIFLSL